MAGYRMDRLAEDIRRELSEIIRNMKDPRASGIVSLVRVELAQDLSTAKVHVSALGGDAEATVKTLNAASGFLRHELSERMHIRHTPALKFVPDHSIEQSVRISKLIDDLNRPNPGKNENGGE